MRFFGGMDFEEIAEVLDVAPITVKRDWHVSLARWKLLERIGEGGLGVVYRAECVEDGVRLEAAIKILRPGFDTGKFREKFLRERQILAGLDHPGIVRLIDRGADSEGRSFLVMEFVRGEPLHEWLARTGPALPARLALFESVCAKSASPGGAWP